MNDSRHSEMGEIKGKYITAVSQSFTKRGLKGFAEILAYEYDGWGVQNINFLALYSSFKYDEERISRLFFSN